MVKRTPVMTQTNIGQPSLADTLLLAVEAEECRDSLKKFVVNAWMYVDPAPFTDGWCVDAICDHLTALTTGQIRFLLINVPPRHSKSTICSVLWPVWCWLHNPEDRFLCASYGLNLAIRDNLKKRNLIDSKWFQDRYGKDFKVVDSQGAIAFTRDKEFSLSENQNAKRFFVNDKMGYQLAVSVGSTTTGEGGSKLVIDDCHSATEAHSQAERDSAVTWFKETWSNRMNDASKDAMLVIGQRIHEEDVSGIILKERPDWIHLNLPAEYEPSRHCFTSIGWSDPRKNEGELLWPERFNQETLNRYKRDLGSIGFAAQYQQSPVPSSGGMFKQEWLRYFTETPEAYILQTSSGKKSILKSSVWEFGTSDLAISSKQTADYTVFCVWCVTNENDLLLLDMFRGRIDNAEQIRQLTLLHARHKCAYWKVETVAYQLSFFQQALRSGIPCREFKPTRDKVSRASTGSVWSENGKIYFREDAPYLSDIILEMLGFPRGAHDDFVDNIGMAADEVCAPRVPLSGEREPEVKSEPLLMQEILKQQVDPFSYIEKLYGGDWE